MSRLCRSLVVDHDVNEPVSHQLRFLARIRQKPLHAAGSQAGRIHQPGTAACLEEWGRGLDTKLASQPTIVSVTAVARSACCAPQAPQPEMLSCILMIISVLLHSLKGDGMGDLAAPAAAAPFGSDPLNQAVVTKLDFKLIVPRSDYHCRRCGGTRGMCSTTAPGPPASTTATTASPSPLFPFERSGSGDTPTEHSREQPAPGLR